LKKTVAGVGVYYLSAAKSTMDNELLVDHNIVELKGTNYATPLLKTSVEANIN